MKIRRTIGIANNVYQNSKNNNSNILRESLDILGNEVEWEEFGGIEILNFENGEINYGNEIMVIFYDWKFGIEDALTSAIKIAA